MKGPCAQTDCSFNITKQCARNYPVEECPYRPDVDADGTVLVEAAADDPEEAIPSEPIVSSAIGAVLSAPEEHPSLPASRTFGLAEANAMMSSRYTNMIGIVGLPGAGKTACLVSAYLLLAKGQFEGFSYADSRTLMAFEEIARGSRTWRRSDPPSRITNHTTMQDDREAGFLHLRLKRTHDGRCFDMLLPDLPGEWSKALIDRRDDGRLQFLKSAAVVWIMVDGREFADAKKVGYARYRTQMLIERLAGTLGDHRPRILLVPTWKDAGEFPEPEFETIRNEGLKWGLEVVIAPIASFSWTDEVRPGEGVPALFDLSLSSDVDPVEFWPKTKPAPGDRALASFRSGI